MSLIVLENASLAFGQQPILEAASLRIGEGEKIGLVGPNGSGKSTLLRVLMGEQPLDEGKVTRLKGSRIGYLPQDILELQGDTLVSSVLATVPGRGDLQQRLEQVEAELPEASDPEIQIKLGIELATLAERLEHFERYYGKHRALRILTGLGFPEARFERSVTELSGGWKMRAALAGLLFQQPDVLFLDEPTNHLDIPTVLWLDRFLQDYAQAVLLICHDREFFNKHCERVVSFEPEGMRVYRGDYETYVTQRAAEQETLEAQTRNRERQVRDMERFVERFRAQATKARQAQSRAKQIERMQREIPKPVTRPRQLRFSFPPTERTGRDVVLIENLGKAFGEQVLYRDATRGVYAGDRIAIIGANGVGKTTLLKMIAGELPPDSGEVRYGSGVKLGYYSQHHSELLDGRLSVLDQVWRTQPRASESKVRGVCGAFLFSGDDVDKSIGVLSGGERARVLLAQLLLEPGNLLLMDEPTNHLDVMAAEALSDALSTFGGTLVFVSHNTAFVNRLATKVWEIDDGALVEHPGNLRDYLERKQRAEALERGRQETAAQSRKKASAPVEAPRDRAQPAPRASNETRQQRRDRKREEAKQRNSAGTGTRRLRDEVRQLEERISRIEAEQGTLEPELATPELYADQPRYHKTLARYTENSEKLTELYGRWEHHQSEIEQQSKALAPGDEDKPEHTGSAAKSAGTR